MKAALLGSTTTAGLPIEIWFQDEALLGQKGTHAYVWAPGWHQTGGDLRTPDNTTLLSLPPDAPALNPMENVWQYLRANKLCAVVWDSDDAIVEAYRECRHNHRPRHFQPRYHAAPPSHPAISP